MTDREQPSPLTQAISRATFRQLTDRYRRDWPVRLCLIEADAGATRRMSCEWWAGRDPAEQRAVMRFALDEALRWGESTVSYGPAGRMYWAAPLMHNAEIIGGLVAAATEDEILPDEGTQLAFDLGKACTQLRLLLEQANLTNAAYLAQQREIYRREQQRAYSLHAEKETGGYEVRHVYLSEEPLLIAAVRRGDRGEARRVLNRILIAMLAKAGDRFELVRSYFMELVASVSRTAVEAGGDPEQLLGANFQHMTDLAGLHTIEQLSPWLSQMLERTMDQMVAHREASSRLLVGHALHYMREHLSGDLSRDAVAEVACCSPSHFSRLFKEHVGQSFSDMLTSMRIDAAREQLLTTDRAVAQVGRAVGFTDPSYFTKVFRRATGKTPLQYRRSADG